MIFPFLVASPQTSYSDTNISNQPKEVQQSEPSKWYYGGTVGFNFWGDYFYLSVNPLVGYQVSPKFSVGGKVHYSYINDSRSELGDFTSHNYGVSIFNRYRPIYQAYLHAEFAYASYENQLLLISVQRVGNLIVLGCLFFCLEVGLYRILVQMLQYMPKCYLMLYRMKILLTKIGIQSLVWARA